MLKNIIPATAALAVLAPAALAQTGTAVMIGPQSATYNGYSRGYNFTAGGDFFIQDFEIPTDNQQAGDLAAVVIRVNGVEQFLAQNSAAAIMTPPAPIQIFTGDVVDIVGHWSGTGNFGAHNSYAGGAPYATSIEGVATNLNRMGIQANINEATWTPGSNYLGAGTGSYGRVLTYTTPPAGIFASFNAAPSTGASPLTVSFTDTTFTDDPAGVQTWDWDFDGDGLSDSSLQNDTFVYGSCGSYDVTLTVTDLINGSSTTTVVGAVTVDEVVASFTVAELASGIWQFTDTSTPTPSSWAWDFDGDGTVDDTTQNPVYAQPIPSPYLTLPTCTLTVGGVGGCFTDTLVENVSETGFGVASGPTGGGNGTLATPAVGTYFDIQVPGEGITITGLQTGVYSYGGAMDCEVYITNGSHVGKDGAPEQWTLVATGSGVAAGGSPVSAPELVTMTLNSSFYLPTGDYGMAIYHINPAGASINVGYTNGPAAAPYGNADLVIHPNGVGCSSTSLLGGCAFSPRLWNGTFSYETCSVSNNATAGSYASGCAGASGIVPSLSVSSLPTLGGTYGLDLDTGMTIPSVALIAVGTNKTIYNGLPLPLDLGVVGAAGCEIATDILDTALLLTVPGSNAWSFPIPNNPALMCFEFFQQGVVYDPAANTLGFVVSNATAGVLGN